MFPDGLAGQELQIGNRQSFFVQDLPYATCHENKEPDSLRTKQANIPLEPNIRNFGLRNRERRCGLAR